jgi:peroxiredoxin
MSLTLIDADGGIHELDGIVSAIDARQLADVTGWVLKPEGLCRGDACTPLLGRVVAAGVDTIDLTQWAAALGHGLAVDEPFAVAALAPTTQATAATVGSVAPDLDLPDLDGTVHALSDLAGRKRVLVTWASWCGCRHELGAWREIQDELGPEGLAIYSVALDNSAEDARPWVEAGAPSYPVVVDTAHVTAERFGITNVPSTVWIDEAGRVVKPPTIAPGDDQFKEFTQIDSTRHHEALRRWVRTGELPATSVPEIAARTPAELLALAERRVGAYLHGAGHGEAAASHLAAAVELAPWDWTVRRANIALRGEDPFLGEEFVAFWQEWDAAGRPGYTTLA